MRKEEVEHVDWVAGEPPFTPDPDPLPQNTTVGKIKLKCQIGDLKSEVTCYVIDADTSYNLLLGRPDSS